MVQMQLVQLVIIIVSFFFLLTNFVHFVLVLSVYVPNSTYMYLFKFPLK